MQVTNNNPPTNNSLYQPQKKSSFQILAAAKVTMLEIIFILFLLALIFYLLNFLHVIQLSKFTLLPHPTQHLASTPTPSGYVLPKEEVLLYSYIKATLRPVYVPQNLAPINTKSITYTPDTKQQLFSLLWTQVISGPYGQGGLVSLVEMKQYNATTYDMTTRLSLSAKNIDTVTPDVANTVEQTFFKNDVFSQWTCNTTADRITCSSSTIAHGTKLLLSVYRVTLIPTRLFALLCTVDPKSPKYNGKNYCLL